MFFYSSVSHAFSYKLLKPHMVAIIQDVIFPVMCFTDADLDLWENDPHEYIRAKFGMILTLSLRYSFLNKNIVFADIFEDYAAPVPAAQSLLHSVCKKRKGVLPKAMQIIMQVGVPLLPNPFLLFIKTRSRS